jgi:hypothetical protein
MILGWEVCCRPCDQGSSCHRRGVICLHPVDPFQLKVTVGCSLCNLDFYVRVVGGMIEYPELFQREHYVFEGISREHRWTSRLRPVDSYLGKYGRSRDEQVAPDNKDI